MEIRKEAVEVTSSFLFPLSLLFGTGLKNGFNEVWTGSSPTVFSFGIREEEFRRLGLK